MLPVQELGDLWSLNFGLGHNWPSLWGADAFFQLLFHLLRK